LQASYCTVLALEEGEKEAAAARSLFCALLYNVLVATRSYQHCSGRSTLDGKFRYWYGSVFCLLHVQDKVPQGKRWVMLDLQI